MCTYINVYFIFIHTHSYTYIQFVFEGLACISYTAIQVAYYWFPPHYTVHVVRTYMCIHMYTFIHVHTYIHMYISEPVLSKQTYGDKRSRIETHICESHTNS